MGGGNRRSSNGPYYVARLIFQRLENWKNIRFSSCKSLITVNGSKDVRIWQTVYFWKNVLRISISSSDRFPGVWCSPPFFSPARRSTEKQKPSTVSEMIFTRTTGVWPLQSFTVRPVRRFRSNSPHPSRGRHDAAERRILNDRYACRRNFSKKKNKKILALKNCKPHTRPVSGTVWINSYSYKSSG